MFFENLESRRLFSAIAAAKPDAGGAGKGGGKGGGGGGGEDPAVVIEFIQEGGVLTVNNAASIQINDYVLGSNPADDVIGDIYIYDKSKNSVEYIFHGVTDLIVNGTSGADNLSASFYNPLNAQINGQGGDDAISVGNNGPATVNIYGGDGSDSIFCTSAGIGITNVYGGAGRDSFASGLDGPLDKDVNWVQ